MRDKTETRLDERTSEIDQRLRVQGHRLTGRRLMVVQALSRHGGHLTVENILENIRQEYPSTNKTTVYRTLELLSTLGMVAVTDLGGGKMEYELVGYPHHHLICYKCGTQAEVDDCFFQPLRESLLKHYGFYANLHHFAMFGLCPACGDGELNPGM
jgi:Fur family ferric uptake transcriptional regulator